jgi:hypothetical protein
MADRIRRFTVGSAATLVIEARWSPTEINFCMID